MEVVANKNYEEESAERDAQAVLVRYETINEAYRVLRDCDSAIRVFYPAADWSQRKGMKQLMGEIDEAQERLLIVIRAVSNPDRDDIQKMYRRSISASPKEGV